MASIYDLKPRFQDLLRPLVKQLVKIGVTANQITVLAILISVATGLAIYFQVHHAWVFLLVPIVLFVRMALNAIDGMIAREHNMQTPLGAILNEIGDVISDVALYLPFALVPGLSPLLIIAVVILAIISEMTGVVAIQIGAQRRYDGPMGKSDRAFIFGIIGLVLGLGYVPFAIINYLLLVLVVLLCFTIINRSKKALGELK